MTPPLVSSCSWEAWSSSTWVLAQQLAQTQPMRGSDTANVLVRLDSLSSHPLNHFFYVRVRNLDILEGEPSEGHRKRAVTTTDAESAMYCREVVGEPLRSACGRVRLGGYSAPGTCQPLIPTTPSRSDWRFLNLGYWDQQRQIFIHPSTHYSISIGAC